MTGDAIKKKILIVDDERDLSSIYKSSFESEGFEVSYCDNGEAALQVARDFRPDLILLDLMMPRLSGFDAIELFRSTPETSAAIIVIFSALSRPEDIAKVKELGADDYIVKSNASFIDVVSRVKALINKTGDSLVSNDGQLQA